ncbi:hypothetical protein ES703_38284 [subsurface metagenome]
MLSLVKHSLPWWAKIAVKIILSRLPVRYNIWEKIKLFKHGSMNLPQYAYSVFTKHFQLAEISSSFVCLELGPGDSLFSALIAKALGAKKTFLVDVGDYANRNMSLYERMYSFLLEQGHKIKVDLSRFENMMHSCRAVYLTSGLRSLKGLPDNSIDFIFSQAVLEHIRKNEFLPIIRQLYRIIKPTGLCSHAVDLKDHLGGGLNNLRFSDSIWESEFFVKSGFYTNRIRFSEMISLFEEEGFQVKTVKKRKWSELPIPKNKLHKQFQKLSNQDLSVAAFTISLTLLDNPTSKIGN